MESIAKIVLVGLLNFNFSHTALAKVIEAISGNAHHSIKNCLAVAQAGDTILVREGIYTEGNITIDKKVTLLGQNFPTLDGRYTDEVMSIKANGVRIKGLRIIRSGVASMTDPCGLKIYQCREVEVINNVFENNFFSIYLQYSNNCLIKDNSISTNIKNEQHVANGIHCWKSDSLEIIHNTIQGHRDGIYFEFVTNSLIWRNVSTFNSRYGLHFMFSNNDAYINNYFESNGAGVAVMFTKQVTMLYNTFVKSEGDAAYGLLLKEISDSHIEGCRFIENTCGVFMEGTSRFLLTSCVFSNNGWGVKIQASCMDNTFYKNNFEANTFDVATNGDLVLNSFVNNYWDKYKGYDLNRDTIGDVRYHPLSLFSVITEINPSCMLLFRSLIIDLLELSEKMFPSITPDYFVDDNPRMKPYNL